MLILNHVVAGQNSVSRRKADYDRIEKTLTVNCNKNRAKASDQSDATILFGDLNYRVNATLGMMKYLIHHGLVRNMVECDQLSAMRKSMGLMCDFVEGDITFAPTFKFIGGTDNYATGDTRIPSYTDRVLYKEKKGGILRLKSYDSNNELKMSDHRPVFAQFTCKIEGEVEGDVGEQRLEVVERIAKNELAFGKCRRAVCNLL